MERLSGRVGIVTGAHGTIGSAIARAFASAGATTVLVARTAGNVERLATEIRDKGGRAIAIPADVTRESDVRALFAQVLEHFGRVDVLVNCAGQLGLASTVSLSLRRWQNALSTNVTSAFLCSREAFAVMGRAGGGRIINIGSLSARVPRPNAIAYTTTKFALEGLTRSLALDGRALGIGVSIVHPGLTSDVRSRDDAISASQCLLGSDVAQVVLTIASLPDGAHLFDATVLPLQQPSFLGRG